MVDTEGKLKESGRLAVGLEKLAARSEELCRLQNENILLADMTEQALSLARTIWDERYAGFVLSEGTIDPPGGGRWNDAKRQAYVEAQFPVEAENLRTAKQAIKRIGIASAQIQNELASLNRLLRILEIGALQGYNKTLLEKLSLASLPD